MERKFKKGDRVKIIKSNEPNLVGLQATVLGIITPASSESDKRILYRIDIDGLPGQRVIRGYELELVTPKRPLILVSEEPVFEGRTDEGKAEEIGKLKCCSSDAKPKDKREITDLKQEKVAVLGIRARWYSEVCRDGFNTKKPTADLHNAMLDHAASECSRLQSQVEKDDRDIQIMTNSLVKVALERDTQSAKAHKWARGYVEKALYKADHRNERLYKSREHLKVKYSELLNKFNDAGYAYQRELGKLNGKYKRGMATLKLLRHRVKEMENEQTVSEDQLKEDGGSKTV